ncbi:MAG: hypothetical protein H0V92_06410 [Pseudonocardiales bacterium]|nr:hypothetical protein [Pseudonocardiales bacterium]
MPGNRSSARQPSGELDPADGLLASAARAMLTFGAGGGWQCQPKLAPP